MTVTLGYDSTNARVTITANGLAGANYATVERSTDQIAWTFIRGGTNVALTAGAFTATIFDYEFTDGVPNFYRVRGIETAPITFVNQSTTVSDANAAGTSTLVPPLPGSLVVGDLMLLRASIRNVGAGVPNTPSGWTKLVDQSNHCLYGRIFQAGDTAPTVSFTGGVANATIEAKMVAYRSAALTPLTSAAQANASAQNVARPALAIPSAGALVTLWGWRQGSATSVDVPAGYTELVDVPIALGGTAHVIMDYQIQTSAVNLPAGSWTVTGGSAAVSSAIVAAFGHAPFLNSQTANLTPTLDTEWLKSPTRPFLNMRIRVADPGTAGRDSRGGASDVVGRTYAIATTDVASGLSFPLVLYIGSTSEAQALDYLIASGDILYIHVRASKDWPGGYVLIGQNPSQRTSPRTITRTVALQCTQIAAPTPDINYANATWQTVFNLYGSWAAVAAANLTWAQVLALLPSPSEVIAP